MKINDKEKGLLDFPQFPYEQLNEELENLPIEEHEAMEDAHSEVDRIIDENARISKEWEKNAHELAMCWLKRKYYELYSLSPTEPEQIETYKRLHQMEIESSLDNLMGEPVKEVELMQI